MKRLTIWEKAEIDEFYDGSMASIKHLAKGLGRSVDCICWYVDYKNRKEQIKKANKKWRENNREKHIESCTKYYYKNHERLKQYAREHFKKKYWADPEKSRKHYRDLYHKNKKLKTKMKIKTKNIEQYRKDYYQAHKADYLRRGRKWQKENRGKCREFSRQYDLKKRLKKEKVYCKDCKYFCLRLKFCNTYTEYFDKEASKAAGTIITRRKYLTFNYIRHNKKNDCKGYKKRHWLLKILQI